MTNYIIMPFLDCWNVTLPAIEDCLAQTIGDVRLLLIDNGSQERRTFSDPRILQWHHTPPLPSLSATWNRALQCVWEAGGERALVVNNDVRLHPQTYETLESFHAHTPAWFVSGVGVTADQFDQTTDHRQTGWFTAPDSEGWGHPAAPGGPDFSCFLITEVCHQQYPFDEHFIPAFCEDLDMHRRLMLDGHGDRIFGVNLPFLHYGSQTLKTMDPAPRARKEAQITQGSRVYYRAKWGGDVNQERYTRPFDPTSAQDGVTTPELQHGQAHRSART